MDLQRFRGRCERAFGDAPPTAILNRVRAIVGSASAMPPTEEGQLAVAGYYALKNGDAPAPKQLAALEWLVRLTRPAPLVHHGRPDDLPTDDHNQTFPGWPSLQAKLQCLRLVGRIDRASPTSATAESIGTGLLVAADLLITNRHVVDDLSRGTDALEAGQAVVRFGWEDGAFTADTPVAITSVEALHPTLDLALVRLAADPTRNTTAIPEIQTAQLDANADLVVVGYPLDDPRRNPLFIRDIFGTGFGVLRAAPGQCTGTVADGLYHDCSTLGGNSGSPVFSMDTARLVGVHSGGGFLWKNTAISAAAVKAFVDSRA